MDRPIHIAVYGHPRAAISSFKLDVIRVDVEKEIDYFKVKNGIISFLLIFNFGNLINTRK